MKTLLECIEDISLFDFIIESQIEIKDLRNKMDFDEITDKEAHAIIDSDEYKHGTELGFEKANDLYDAGTGFVNSNHFKITYEGNILGIIGFSTLKMLRSYDSGNDGTELSDILSKSIRAVLSDNFDNLLGDDNIYTKNDVSKLGSNLVYITYLQISEEAKKKLDISPIAVIKVLTEKISDFFKENKIKYVCAFGKDPHRAKTYIKALGFSNISDNTLKNTQDGKRFASRVGYETAKCFVIKKIF